MKKVHFIAIGGSAMHNLAIALHLKGFHVTGSDDEIFDPAKSRLEKYGLLPPSIGWDSHRITETLDAVILGMHARLDNPELLKAKELGLKVFSYPEYLYEQSKDKTRIVIGGSHGKTSITAMVLHVMQQCGVACDYMVGAQLEGFEVMVKLTESAPFMVIEGDEYLTSPIDLRPKFHLYHPHIAIINGIAWDHINVFPTFEKYVEQFSIFANLIMPNGYLLYYAGDSNIVQIANQSRADIHKIPYDLPNHKIVNGKTILLFEGDEYPLRIFGKHNLQNLYAAWQTCKLADIKDKDFLSAIQSFKGASKRLELLGENTQSAVYKDFAHAPSKLQATVEAMKTQYPQRKLVACLELHTFSSLNPAFLNEYAGSFSGADCAIVYFNLHTLEHKNLPLLTKEMVKQAFKRDDLIVVNDSKELEKMLYEMTWQNTNLLLMSSGNFDGIDDRKLIQLIIQ